MTDHRYDDIIGLPHPDPARHPRMSMAERAAQFAPFAALTGYAEAIRETARQTEERRELDDQERAALDKALSEIRDHLAEHPAVSLTYFMADRRKAGGTYLTIEGRVRNIDDAARTLVLENGKVLPLRDIVFLVTAAPRP